MQPVMEGQWDMLVNLITQYAKSLQVIWLLASHNEIRVKIERFVENI